MASRTIRYSILIAVYLATAGLTYGLHPNLGLANPRYGLIHMVRGDAHEPFVRRALVPTLVRGTDALLPNSVRGWINQKANRRVNRSGIRADFLAEKQEMFGVMSTNWSIAAVGAFYIVLSLAGTLFVLRRLLVVLYYPPSMVADVFPLLLIAMLPVFRAHSNFIYDYPGLLLFALATLCIVTKQWRAYGVTYVLALLNKETAVLLPLVFAVTQYDVMERKRLVKNIAAQVATAVVVLGSLAWMFHNNPGEVAEVHPSRNVAFLTDIRNFFRFDSLGPSLLAPGGLPVRMPVGLNLPYWLVVAGCIVPGWRSAPPVLRRSLLALLVPLVLLQFFFGFVDEVRDLYEAMPVIIALMYASANRVWGPRTA